MCHLKPLLHPPWVTLLNFQSSLTEKRKYTVAGQFINKIQMPAKHLSYSRRSRLWTEATQGFWTVWESINYAEAVWELWVALRKLTASLSLSLTKSDLFPFLFLSLKVVPWCDLLSSQPPFLWPRICLSSLLPSTSKGLAAPGVLAGWRGEGKDEGLLKLSGQRGKGKERGFLCLLPKRGVEDAMSCCWERWPWQG